MDGKMFSKFQMWEQSFQKGFFDEIQMTVNGWFGIIENDSQKLMIPVKLKILRIWIKDEDWDLEIRILRTWLMKNESNANLYRKIQQKFFKQIQKKRIKKITFKNQIMQLDPITKIP